MTGQNIYETASAFLYEADGEDLDSKKFSVAFLNVLLQEALPVENSIRRALGETELSSAPYLTALTDTIPYDDSITRIALPYGVASYLFQEAMNNYQAENYRAKCISALNDARKYTPETIKNYYEGEV